MRASKKIEIPPLPPLFFCKAELHWKYLFDCHRLDGKWRLKKERKGNTMLKVSHVTLIALSGLVWLAVGCFLLPLGLNFVVGALLRENAALPHPVLNFFASFTGGMDQAALVWIGLMLFIGFLKGRSVFAKSVQRSVNRIYTLLILAA